MKSKKPTYRRHQVLPEGEDLDYKTVKTVPNQSLTVKDILTRFVKKQDIPQKQNPIFIDQEDEGGDDIDFEKLHRADLVDKENMAHDMSQRALDSRRRLARLKKVQEDTEKSEKEKLDKKPPENPATPPSEKKES